MEELVYFIGYFKQARHHMYLRNCLLSLSKLLYVKNNGHVFWNAFKSNMEDFSTEDLENLHSQLSLLMSRMADRSDDDGIQERFRLLPEITRIESLVKDIYGAKETNPDKRRSGKTIPSNSPEVEKSYAYMFDVLTLLEEHYIGIPAQIANLSSGQIETVDDLQSFAVKDHLYYFPHPLSPVPISSAQLPLGNIAEYIRHDIANLKNWLTGNNFETCGCKSGCATRNCKCRASQSSCTDACKCEKALCTNKQ